MQPRWRALALTFLAYAVSFFACKNYPVWLRYLVVDAGQAAGAASVLGSGFQLCSSVSKVAGGAVVDNNAPVAVLAVSLAVCGLMNVLLWQCQVAGWWWAALASWCTVGLFQALAWPAVVRVFATWFPHPGNRARWYSVLASSQSVSAAATPALLTWASATLGWSASLVLPGVAACGAAVVIHRTLRCNTKATRLDVDGGGPGLVASLRRIVPTLRTVVGHRRLRPLMAAYFLLSVVRTGLSDWTPVMLADALHLDAAAAARCLFVMEAAGLVVALLGGWASDRLFAGQRPPVMSLTVACAAVAMACLWRAVVAPPVAPWQLLASFAAAGAFTFCPHVLTSLASRELTPASIGSSAMGFVKGVGQVGGALAGAPLAVVVAHVGWSGFLMALAACCVGAAVMYARVQPPPKPASVLSDTEDSDG